jgi:hypothetical protein
LLRETSDGKDFLQARQKNSGGAKGAFDDLDAEKVSKVALIPVKAGMSMEMIENSRLSMLERSVWDTHPRYNRKPGGDIGRWASQARNHWKLSNPR